jgi:hypothetical protein
MTSFIPITHIQSVFKAREAHIRAVILSLPSEPVNVKTPELLARVTGKEWSETIISHDLFQIWLAVLFIIKSFDVERGEWDAVGRRLQEEQEDAYARYSENAFTIAYLNAYERAILKYMHLLQRKEAAPTTPHIMNMAGVAEDMGLSHLFTRRVTPPTDALEEYAEKHREAQAECGL